MACNECGHVFDEEDMISEIEYTGVHSEGFSETVERHYCPNCGDEYIEKAHRCQFCGGWARGFICAGCKSLIKKDLTNLIKMSETLHKMNGVEFHEAYPCNAISDVLEEL